MNLYPSDISDVHTLASFVWFVIEQLVFISLIVSNMLFLGIRSCFTHKLRLSAIDEKRQLPTVDTLIAISELANAFNAQFTPWFVNNYLNLTNLNQDDGSGDIGPQLQIILISNYVSFAAILFLIFCPWKTGPSCYLRFSHYLFFAMVWLNYLLLPLMNIGVTAYYSASPQYVLRLMPLESWVIFFTVICFTRLMEYYFSLRKIISDDAKIHLAMVKEVPGEG